METTEPPIQKLYSPGQIALAAVLGSPLAACWFFACNFRELGQPKTAKHYLIWGGIGTAVLLVIAFFLPDRFPNSILPIAYTAGLFQAAKQLHGTTVARHISAGGRLGSWWSVVGISLLCLILVVVALIGIVLLLSFVSPDRFAP
jgi:hypothetical protein